MSASSLEDPAKAIEMLGPSLATKPPASATSVLPGETQFSDSMLACGEQEGEQNLKLSKISS